MNDLPSPADDSPAPARLPGARRRSWLRLFLYLTIFVSGAVVGTGGALIFVRNQVLRAAHHPEEMPAVIARRMRRVLSLDDEQTRRVEAILRERQGELQSLRREYQPRVEQQLDLLEAQISEVLNQQQRASWQSRIRELRETWIPELPPDKED